MSLQLPDFTLFEPFNRLRESMNATKLGYFELFNPQYHLTGEERSLLERGGIEISSDNLHHLLDFTLVYKNSRVILLADNVYHLARCSKLPSQGRFKIATKVIGDKSLSVCPDCLSVLHYKGYDPLKARKEAYSRAILDSFSLSEFKTKYPFYPVSEKRELRKKIVLGQ